MDRWWRRAGGTLGRGAIGPREAERLQPGDRIRLKKPIGDPNDAGDGRVLVVKRVRLAGEEIETEDELPYECWEVERAREGPGAA